MKATMNIDVNWDYNCLAFGEEGIARLVAEAARAGFRQMNFRVSNKGGLNCRTRTGTIYHEKLDAFGETFDPLSTFIQSAHREGLRACIWLDLFEGCYDEFLRAHPHLYMQAHDGKPGMTGVPAFCCDEVCHYYLSLLDEWLSLQPDEILFCTKSAHVPKNFTGRRELDCGYNPPALEKYRQEYGSEPVEREKLAEVHGELLLEFIRQARLQLNGNGIELSLALPANNVPLNGTIEKGINIRLDWRKTVRKRAADTIILTNNRQEAYLLYQPAGRELLAEARALCTQQQIALQAYVFADNGVYGEVEKQAGFAGLLKFIPLHLAYLHEQRIEQVLFHDLDLLHVEPWYRRVLWPVVGSAAPAGWDDTGTWQELVGEAFDGKLSTSLANRILSSGSTGAPSLPPKDHSAWSNYSMEYSLNRDVPEGWSRNVPQENKKLFAEYDWKVMHGDARSGRVFSGRSSVLLGGLRGVGLSDARCASWDAKCSAPKSKGKATVRVWAHGEGLHGVESSGMRIELINEKGNILETHSSVLPERSTFPWRVLSAAVDFEPRDVLLHVSLFLHFQKVSNSEGCLWFDQFEIVPVEERKASE